MTTQEYAVNQKLLYEKGPSLWEETEKKLYRALYGITLFHTLFLIIGLIEVATFIALFTLLSLSTLLAFSLALIFLTLFAYFTLRLYIQAKRIDMIEATALHYREHCEATLHYQEGIVEHHIALASLLQKFSTHLLDKEYRCYHPPALLKSLSETLEKLSCISHWRDFHQLRERLLLMSIKEHIKVIMAEPTNLEVHAALANAYVMLSTLYADPQRIRDYDEEKWTPPEKSSPEMEKKFRQTAERAIEEFKILGDYAPNDPWVHIQLAYSYHDLQMPEMEIKEYEQVLKLRPDDNDTLFKLGVLYFQQGKNAQGLRIYEILCRTHYKKAESLIKFYGAIQSSA